MKFCIVKKEFKKSESFITSGQETSAVFEKLLQRIPIASDKEPQAKSGGVSP